MTVAFYRMSSPLSINPNLKTNELSTLNHHIISAHLIYTHFPRYLLSRKRGPLSGTYSLTLGTNG